MQMPKNKGAKTENSGAKRPAPPGRLSVGIKKPSCGFNCLLWSGGALFCLLLASLVIIGAVYAGWGAGLATARANATGTAAAEQEQQCARIPADLAAGNLPLAQTRLEALRSATPAPACLLRLAPTATAYALQAAQIATSPTAAISATTALPPTAASAAAFAYDLEALLLEARDSISLSDYPAAIDTLAAIISIDSDFQRETVRRLYLGVLKAQAQALFRSGNLSEAIVLSTRAEVYGSIDELQYERYIAELYLDGQRYKTVNPAEAIRLFSIIVYDYDSSNYMSGQVLGELQDALRYYADALLFQGDPCPAIEQYAAALNLQPSYWIVSRELLTSKKQQAEQACQEQQLTQTAAPPISITGTALAGAPTSASPAPVGQQSG